MVTKQSKIRTSKTDTPKAQVCEITPEMIEAGVCEFFDFDLIEDDPDRIVTAIYQAMRLQETPR